MVSLICALCNPLIVHALKLLDLQPQQIHIAFGGEFIATICHLRLKVNQVLALRRKFERNRRDMDDDGRHGGGRDDC